MADSINALALNNFKFADNLIHITTVGGSRLSILEAMPGHGGFGNNAADDHIVIDGREARFVDDHGAQAIGYRMIEFV